jgi:hypothetical protein
MKISTAVGPKVMGERTEDRGANYKLVGLEMSHGSTLRISTPPVGCEAVRL